MKTKSRLIAKDVRNKLEELLYKTVETRERKQEAFNKKREILREQSMDKFLAKTAKIESARQRKHEEVERIRKSASATVKKALASKQRKQRIDKKVQKLCSMISSLSENRDWKEDTKDASERTVYLENQNTTLKNQVKKLEQIKKFTEDSKNIKINKSAMDLNKQTLSEEDIFQKDQADQAGKADSSNDKYHDTSPQYSKSNSEL